MSTRSRLIIANPKGDFTSIYCHWDGYPAHVGKLLLNHYAKPSQARALIWLGDLSSLGERRDPIGPHSFDEAERGTTVAYGRDRGEPSPPLTTATLQEAVEAAENCWAEYVYLYWNGQWSYQTVEAAAARQPFIQLTDANTRKETV